MSGPLLCRYCGKPAKLVTGDAIYGSRYAHIKLWACMPCDAYVGCHGDTDTPKGDLANKELRAWRKATHKLLDPIWRDKYMARSEAYHMLAGALRIDRAACHVGLFDVERCKAAVETLQQWHAEVAA